MSSILIFLEQYLHVDLCTVRSSAVVPFPSVHHVCRDFVASLIMQLCEVRSFRESKPIHTVGSNDHEFRITCTQYLMSISHLEITRPPVPMDVINTHQNLERYTSHLAICNFKPQARERRKQVSVVQQQYKQGSPAAVR